MFWTSSTVALSAAFVFLALTRLPPTQASHVGVAALHAVGYGMLAAAVIFLPRRNDPSKHKTIRFCHRVGYLVLLLAAVAHVVVLWLLQH